MRKQSHLDVRLAFLKAVAPRMRHARPEASKPCKMGTCVANARREARFAMGLLSLFREMMDVRFGSLWTNIPRSRFEELGVDYGQRVEVTIQDDTRTVYRNFLTNAHSFSDVFVGEPLVYANSLYCMSAAINQRIFA